MVLECGIEGSGCFHTPPTVNEWGDLPLRCAHSMVQGKGAEGRGRLAQAQRRMLMVEVEKAVMTCQMSSDEGRVSDFKISPPHSSKDVKLFCDGYFQ